MTVAQNRMFYSHNWVGGLIMGDKKNVPGLFVHQACTTSATCINLAAVHIEAGLMRPVLHLWQTVAQRTAPCMANPMGPGGEVISENWNMDNFNNDPGAA